MSGIQVLDAKGFVIKNDRESLIDSVIYGLQINWSCATVPVWVFGQYIMYLISTYGKIIRGHVHKVKANKPSRFSTT